MLSDLYLPGAMFGLFAVILASCYTVELEGGASTRAYHTAVQFPDQTHAARNGWGRETLLPFRVIFRRIA